MPTLPDEILNPMSRTLRKRTPVSVLPRFSTIRIRTTRGAFSLIRVSWSLLARERSGDHVVCGKEDAGPLDFVHHRDEGGIDWR